MTFLNYFICVVKFLMISNYGLSTEQSKEQSKAQKKLRNYNKYQLREAVLEMVTQLGVCIKRRILVKDG